MFESVPASDLGLKIISALFVAGDGAISPLMSAFSVFSGAMLAIAGLMLAWHTLAGVVATAKEGKILGTQWHTIWAPIRITLGVGLLVPAFNGATAGQLIVKEVATLSSKMASEVWFSFSENMLTSSAEVPALDGLGGRDVARGLADKTFCFMAAREILDRPAGKNTPATNLLEKEFAGRKYLNWPSAATLGETGATLDFGSLCGVVVIPISVQGQSVTTSTKSWGDAQVQNTVDALNAVVDSGLVSEILAATSPKLPLKNPPSRESWVAMIDSVALKYDENQRAAAATLVDNSTTKEADRLLAAVGSDGWVAAGVYWRNLSVRQRTFVSAATSRVTFTPAPILASVGKTEYGDLASMFKFFDRVTALPERGDRLEVARDYSAKAASIEKIAETGGADVAAKNAIDKFMDWISSGFQKAMLAVASMMTDPTADPIGALSGSGHTLTNWGSGIATLALASAAAGKLPIIGGVAAATAGFGAKIALFVIAIGALYAYVLPILPFIFVLLLAFGWVVLIVEAMVAIIVWAFTLVRMDGQDLLDQSQRAGALILLNLLIRPTLGILGLCCVYYVLPILLRIVNDLAVPAFFASQGAGSVALVGGSVGLMIVAYIHYQLVVRTVSLITDLPDRITRWFGAHPEGLGETRHAEAAAGAATGAVMGSNRTLAAEAAGVIGQRKPKQLVDPLKETGGDKTASAPRGKGDM